MKVAIKRKILIRNCSFSTTKEGLLLLFVILMAFFAPMGAAAYSINIGIGQISFSRLFLLLAFFQLITLQKIRLWIAGNKYSMCFLLCWLMYSFISILWARDLNGFVRMAFFLFVGVMTILLVNNIGGRTQLYRIILGFDFGILLQGIMGLIEYITGKYFFLSDVNIAVYQLRGYRYPVAMLGNPNDFATAMYIGVIFSGYVFLDEKTSGLKKHLSAIMCAFYSYLIIISGSRATLYGLIIAILFVSFFRLKRSKKILIIIFVAISLPFVISKLISYVDFGYYLAEGESFSIRVNLIRNGLRFLIDAYGFGVGNGQIEYWMMNYGIWDTNGIVNIHNYWAEILVAYGLLIFVGFMVFYIKMIVDFYKSYSANKKTVFGKRMLVLSAGVAGLFMTLISSSSNLSKEYVWMFWSICIANQGLIGSSTMDCDLIAI